MLLTLALPFGCVGCSSGGSASYDRISGAEAKALMDSESGYIIIDARTQEEYDAGHIPGAILIPEYEIAARAENELSDKNQLILVYCRSGGKAGETRLHEYRGVRRNPRLERRDRERRMTVTAQYFHRRKQRNKGNV